MADFLLVHDAGQGSWCWGRVWGHLTAPREHPPRLYARGSVGNVVALDLPGHGPRARQDTSSRSLDEFVTAVATEMRSHNLRDLIVTGHGVAASVILQAATQLEEPPRRVVLFAGIIPDEGKNSLDMLPRASRLGFKIIARLNRILKKDFRLPKAAIANIYCNGMDPLDVVQIVGRFSPIPLELVLTRVNLSELALNCPITYVPLWRDSLVPSVTQKRMAQRLEGVEVAGELNSCHQVMIEHPKQVADILLRYV